MTNNRARFLLFWAGEHACRRKRKAGTPLGRPGLVAGERLQQEAYSCGFKTRGLPIWGTPDCKGPAAGPVGNGEAGGVG